LVCIYVCDSDSDFDQDYFAEFAEMDSLRGGLAKCVFGMWGAGEV
jgi:hypothetical protein